MPKRLFRTTAILLSLIVSAAPVMAAVDDDDRDIAGELTSPEPSASPVEGGVDLTAPAPGQLTFHIFSITGQLVKTVSIREETVRIELPRGCYVVKCGRWSKKILIH